MMPSGAIRVLLVLGAAIASYAAAVFALLQIIPGPRSSGDYLIIGCLATLFALLVTFVVVIKTVARAPDPFFRRRRKE